jgi:hypothetical protein
VLLVACHNDCFVAEAFEPAPHSNVRSNQHVTPQPVGDAADESDSVDEGAELRTFRGVLKALSSGATCIMAISGVDDASTRLLIVQRTTRKPSPRK